MQPIREPSASESYFWPSVWAVALHILIFGMLFVSFAMTPDLPEAKPIVQATLYQLKSKSRATTQTNQKIAGEAKKTLRDKQKSNSWSRKRSSSKTGSCKSCGTKERRVCSKSRRAESSRRSQKRPNRKQKRPKG